MLDEWKIEKDETITHLHTKDENGKVIKVQDRYICNSCKSPVPTLVMENAKKKGTQNMESDVPRKSGKTKKLTIEEMKEAINENPELAKQLGLNVPTATNVPTALTTVPAFELIPANMIYFPQGKPDKETREFLKAHGYTFRMGHSKGEKRDTWVGPVDTLKGTPFDK